MSDFRSAVSQVSWPALPGMMESQILAQLYQLQQSEWWTADELVDAQHTQLRALLSYTLKHSRFYQRRFDAAGLSLTPDELIAHWREVPVLGRPEVQEAGDLLRCHPVPVHHGELLPVQTSGSTGRPIRTCSTAITRLDWMVHTLRDHLWHNRDPKGKLVAVRPDRNALNIHGDYLPSWGPPVDRLFVTGPSALLDSRNSIERQIEWLQEQQPTYLLSLPSNVRALAEHCRETDIALPELKAVRTLGEVMSPQLRELCRSVWGVPLTDVYSAQEVGYIGLQCPEQSHYHLQSEHLLIEVLNEQGQPCKPGDVGRLLVTTLHNFATPLIRYEIMDYVELGDSCSCGRGLPVIKRVMGRHRNMAVSPEGRRFYPSFPAESWMHIAPIRQIQMVQNTPSQIELRLVADRELDPSEKTQLSASLQQSLGHSYNFCISYLTEVPRSANGKYEDFICQV